MSRQTYTQINSECWLVCYVWLSINVIYNTVSIHHKFSNALPPSLKSQNLSYDDFKSRLKTHLFNSTATWFLCDFDHGHKLFWLVVNKYVLQRCVMFFTYCSTLEISCKKQKNNDSFLYEWLKRGFIIG